MNLINSNNLLSQNSYVAFKNNSDKDHHKKHSDENKFNKGALIGTTLGTAASLALMARHQKVKPWNINYDFNEMMGLGTGAIIGGLAGGIVGDKGKHKVAKVKEYVYQFVTNLVVPTFLVDQFMKIGNKVFDSQSIIEKYKNPKTRNLVTFNQKAATILSRSAAAVSGVLVGTYVGSLISAKINDKFVHHDEKYKRTVEPKDLKLHLDDVVTALTLSKVPLVDKCLPPLSMISGYEAGQAK